MINILFKACSCIVKRHLMRSIIKSSSKNCIIMFYVVLPMIGLEAICLINCNLLLLMELCRALHRLPVVYRRNLCWAPLLFLLYVNDTANSVPDLMSSFLLIILICLSQIQINLSLLPLPMMLCLTLTQGLLRIDSVSI